MHFVRLLLDANYGDYSYDDSSNTEMAILGCFLKTDVSCCPAFLYSSQTWQDWVMNDDLGDATFGNATSLEKDGPHIYLEDLWPDPKEAPIRVKMLRSQLVKLLDDWRDKVCAKMPKEVVIMHENGEFWIETKD